MNNPIYIPTEITSYIIGEYTTSKELHDDFLLCDVSLPDTIKIFLPYYYHDHWRLMIVNMDLSTTLVLDPFGKKASDRRRATNLF